jgi:hypothetical protein
MAPDGRPDHGAAAADGKEAAGMIRPDAQTCVSCKRSTGLLAGVEGEAGRVVALLVGLGMPRDQAEATVSGQAGGPVVFSICDWCARRAGLDTALNLDGLDVPLARQPSGGGS